MTDILEQAREIVASATRDEALATIERERRQEEALRCDFEEELKAAQARIAALEAQPSAQLWHPMTSEPDIGRKFIALYNDGSGAVMFWRHDGGLIDQDGDEAAFPPQGFDCWAYLPGELEFLCETRGEDPMKLTCTQSTAAQPSAPTMPYPNDLGLKPQVREFGDSLSAFTVAKEHFFPETAPQHSGEAQPSAQFVAGKLEGLRRAAEIVRDNCETYSTTGGDERKELSPRRSGDLAGLSYAAAILAEAALKGEGE